MSMPPEFYWSETRKVDSLAMPLRLRVRALLPWLQSQGWEPRVWYGWRSRETQAELVRRGVSKTLDSRHCIGLEGDAEAFDIVDRRYGWGEHPSGRMASPAEREHVAKRAVAFFHVVGKWALGEGLVCGGTWPPINPDTGLGWDPCHVQLSERLNHGTTS